MKQVSQDEFCDFLETHQMKLVGISSPMPMQGYGDDREYYEGNGREAECRTRWEPSFRQEFWINEKPAASGKDGG